MVDILHGLDTERGRAFLDEANPGRPLRFFMAGISALCMLAGAALAEQTESAKDRKLQFSSTLYLWASGLQGTQSIFGLPSVDVDVSFSDVFDKVDMAAAGIFEVYGERAGFLGEFNYVKLGATATGPGGILQGGMDSKAFFALAAGTWKLAETDQQHVDLVAGVKYFRFDNDLQLNPGALSASQSANWVDATVGVKASFELAPKWSMKTWAMVGAGGSDLSWDILAAFDYQFNEDWSASFGYRAIGVDYTSNAFSYDMRQYGPIIGVTRRF